MAVRAVRGAITVVRNDKEEILEATSRLLKEIIARNDVSKEDVISVLFTATGDLNGEFPAYAARKIGLNVPLMCAREMDVPGALPMCIRVMMHINTDKDFESLRHPYLEDADRLSRDLPQ